MDKAWTVPAQMKAERLYATGKLFAFQKDTGDHVDPLSAAGLPPQPVDVGDGDLGIEHVLHELDVAAREDIEREVVDALLLLNQSA